MSDSTVTVQSIGKRWHSVSGPLRSADEIGQRIVEAAVDGQLVTIWLADHPCQFRDGYPIADVTAASRTPGGFRSYLRARYETIRDWEDDDRLGVMPAFDDIADDAAVDITLTAPLT
ncbi:hypothetical protein [Desertimonas flava]|uniref:hypothetical protein n=1 Tax=Desertimonas flava TaxID=2064846 RepID=UPI000E352589|nr:hypothetical protein [Desertimonas flava]